MARKRKMSTEDDVAPTTPDDDEVTGEEADSSGELTAQKVLRMWQAGREDTVGERFNYWMNRAFWQGSQWLQFSKGYESASQIEPITTSKTKQRTQSTTNKIQPAVNNAIARGTKIPLVLEVMAESADDYAHQGAQTGEGLLRQKGLDDDWEVIRESAMTATWLGGTGGLALIWNPAAKHYSDDIKGGDGELVSLSIEDFVVEPGSKDAVRARWWIRKQVLPAAAVKAAFKLKNLPKEDATDGGPFSGTASEQYAATAGLKGTQVLTYYERPNHLRPRGAVCVVVGNEIVWGKKDENGKMVGAAPWSYEFDDHLNLRVLTAIKDPEKWTGLSPVTQAISPQRQFNQAWTKIHETTHRTVGAKLMMDARHAELNKQLNDDPEDFLKMAPLDNVRDPKYLEFPQLPAYIIQELQELKEALDDALGVHDISRGTAGVNAPDSGYGLSILAENDATPVGRLVKITANGFAGVSSDLLKMYCVKVTETRKTVATDRSGFLHPLEWTGKDLNNQTRVIVPADSVLPKSEAGMLKMATDILQMKPDWFSSFSQWASMASVPGFNDMSKIMDDDIASAEYENGRMAAGEVMQVQDFDNHPKHIQQHNHFRKSPRYRTLPDKYKQIFDAHVSAHKRAQQAEVAQQQALQNMVSMTGGQAAPQVGQPPQPQAPGDINSLSPSGGEAFVPQVPLGAE